MAPNRIVTSIVMNQLAKDIDWTSLSSDQRVEFVHALWDDIGGDPSPVVNGIDVSGLDRAERTELAQTVWNSVVDEGFVQELTVEQKAELDRRIKDHEDNPDDVVPWEDVRRELLGD